MEPRFSPVARSIPFDKTGLGFTSQSIQDALAELLASKVWDQASTASTLNGTLTMTSSSKALQFITGTQTGFSVVLPDATSIFLGTHYEIANASSQSLSVKDGGGTILFTLVANSIGFFSLRTAGSAAGVWVFYQSAISDASQSVTNYHLNSTTPFGTTSASDVLITGFSITPASGTYGVFFNASLVGSTGSGSHFWSVYKNGVQVADSERKEANKSGAQSNSTQTVVSMPGAQAVDVRVRTGSGTCTVNARSLVLIRLGQQT